MKNLLLINTMSDDLSTDKLYVSVVCSICRGNKKNAYNKNCFYCDNGRTFIESTLSNIKIQLTKMDKDSKINLINTLSSSL